MSKAPFTDTEGFKTFMEVYRVLSIYIITLFYVTLVFSGFAIFFTNLKNVSLFGIPVTLIVLVLLVTSIRYLFERKWKAQYSRFILALGVLSVFMCVVVLLIPYDDLGGFSMAAFMLVLYFMFNKRFRLFT